MRKPQLLNQLVTAIAVIAGVGIAAAPAQAGTLEFDDATDEFFAEVTPENLGDTFTVQFSPGGISDSFQANGEFVPPFTFANASNPVLIPTTANEAIFELVSAPIVDRMTDTFTYELQNNLTFQFDPDSDTITEATVTYGAGTTFVGDFDFIGNNLSGVGFEEDDIIDPVVTIDGQTYVPGDPNFPLNAQELTFSDLATPDDGGGYEAQVNVSGTSVPEPTTILGLLAVGGLGLGLKRKKQVS